jgi:ATPase subunit of ABC transporter with duplicated ATPase domains
MKKIKVLLGMLILIYSGCLCQPLLAQEQSKEQQEKQAKLQQLIEEQKKAMMDQKNAQEDAKEQYKKQSQELNELMEDVNNQVDASTRERTIRIYSPRGDRFEPFIVGNDADRYFGHVFGSDAERTTWDFSKTVKESTFKKEYSFDVEKSATTVIMSVMGDCKSGDIDIKIIMPSGKSYSDIIIDQNGNLNWRKSFGISETENQDKTGEWKFQINSNKATGYFKISLQTF